jgi:hypothetical protein
MCLDSQGLKHVLECAILRSTTLSNGESQTKLKDVFQIRIDKSRCKVGTTHTHKIEMII